MNKVVSISIGNLCLLLALLVSLIASEKNEMQESIMQRRGKMKKPLLGEFLENHRELAVGMPNVQTDQVVDVYGQEDRDLLSGQRLTRETFCSDLSPVEQFLEESFLASLEEGYNVSVTTDPNTEVAFKCDCREQDINLYLQCTNAYTYLDNQGVAREIAQFQAKNGVYELIKTSWGDTRFGSMADDQEEFFYQNERLIECRYADCLSCRICADGLSARCEDINLADDTWPCLGPDAYFSAYDFGTIYFSSAKQQRSVVSTLLALLVGATMLW